MIIAIQPFEVMTQLCASNSILPSHRIIAPGTMIGGIHLFSENSSDKENWSQLHRQEEINKIIMMFKRIFFFPSQ
jgi:hypothetical protein